MKIIDKSKFLPDFYKRNNFEDEKEIRIWFNTLYKRSVKENIYLYTNKEFKIKKELKPFENEELKSTFIIRNKIIEDKVKKNELKIATISETFKMKSFGNIASTITSINSFDPRFLLLWVYNSNIEMDINVYSKYRMKFNNYEDFLKFTDATIEKEEFWYLFLAIFPSTQNKPLAGFGQKTFEKLMKNFNEENILKFLKISSEELDVRKNNVHKLVKEIA